VTDGTAPLFDVDLLRAQTTAVLGVRGVVATTVVIGSRQPVSDLDDGIVSRAGVPVRRRRGGGGAVLLAPQDCWIELWLPAGGSSFRDDVRATACLVGECWQSVLGSFGIHAEIHRSAVLRADEGSVACFAGLGPGELTVQGRKLLGLSQWRSREGALVSSVIPSRSPASLRPYLAQTAPRVPALDLATSLDEVLEGVTGAELARAFAVHAATVLGAQEASTELFT
jgi:hypothetical protein